MSRPSTSPLRLAPPASCFRLAAALLLGLLLLPGVVPAALELPDSYWSRQWGSDSGLPGDNVRCLTQTADGYLWLGVDAEVVRFDGVRAAAVGMAGGGGFAGSILGDLCATRAGGLWAGTQDGQIWQCQDGAWQRHASPLFTRSNIVLDIFEDRHSGIWIGTRFGLIRQQGGGFAAVGAGGPLRKAAVRCITEDAAGDLWVGYTGGVAQLRDGRVTRVLAVTNGLVNAFVRAIRWDRRGDLWIGSNAGLTRWREGRFQHFSKADGLPDNVVKTLLEDQRGNLWIGTSSGIGRWDHAQDRCREEWTVEGISYPRVGAMIEDREGSIWVGCNEGVFRLTPRPVQSWTQHEGLAHNNVISIMESRSGRLWIATWGSGLQYYEGGRSGILCASNTPGLRSDLMLCMAETRDGSFWFGTDYDGGLYRLKGDRLTRFAHQQGVPGTAIRAIHEDRSGRLWVASSGGLHWMETNGFVRVSPTNGLWPIVVRCVAEDAAGTLWAGTDQGLFRREGERWTGFGAAQGLPGGIVYALLADTNGLWVATQGGLCRYAEGRLQTLTVRQGLFQETVLDVIEDDRGCLWLASPRGVGRARKQEVLECLAGRRATTSWDVFAKPEGMASDLCVSAAKPSSWKTRDGRLWFATTKGLAVMDPKVEVRRNTQPPPVWLEQVVANGVSNSLDVRVTGGAVGGTAPRGPHAPGGLELVVPPGRGDLEVSYTALSLVAPEKNRFRYRLDGLDQHWTEAGPRRVAYYNNLEPGAYTFRVVACNNDGVWNELGAAARIVLRPHFWQTWWFKLLGVLALLAAVYALDRLRLARLHEIERLRLRIAADLHDEVGSNLGSVALASSLLAQSRTLSEEERKDVALISRVTAETAGAVKDIVWFTNPGYDTLQDLVMRMKDTADTMLGSFECAFGTEVEDLTRKLPLDFRKNVFLIYKESLANILKHAGATRVDIHVSVRDGVWRLRLQDNGRGFDPAAKYSGNGLKNLRRRAAQIGGAYEVRSQPGQGTVVEVEVRDLERGLWTERWFGWARRIRER